MPDRLLAHMFRELVARSGGVDAAAAAIEASTGEPVSRGTISKIQNGNAEVPLAWAWALEDHTGNLCFDRYRNRKVEASGGLDRGEVSHLVTMRESHEAVMAQAAAEVSDDAGCINAALKEMHEMIAAGERTIGALERKLAALGLEADEGAR